MKSLRSFAAPFVVLSIVVLAVYGSPLAQETFEPKSGQTGKDVVWVPTPHTLVEKMLDMANVTPDDFVIDLGSGDGRTVIAAAKRGARGRGIEYNPDMVVLAQRRAVEEGVSDRVEFVEADVFESDFSEATVLTLFLLPRLNVKLRPKILDLEPGTRVVSNAFTMGDWTPDERGQISEDCGTYCTAYLWIVPAKVAGTWRFPEGTLQIEQKFQKIAGSLDSGRGTESIENGTVRGDEVSFSAAGKRYVGRVDGDTIEGTILVDEVQVGEWKADRAG